MPWQHRLAAMELCDVAIKRYIPKPRLVATVDASRTLPILERPRRAKALSLRHPIRQTLLVGQPPQIVFVPIGDQSGEIILLHQIGGPLLQLVGPVFLAHWIIKPGLLIPVAN